MLGERERDEFANPTHCLPCILMRSSSFDCFFTICLKGVIAFLSSKLTVDGVGDTFGLNGFFAVFFVTVRHRVSLAMGQDMNNTKHASTTSEDEMHWLGLGVGKTG